MRDWAAEHAAGSWSYLSEPAEQARLALIGALAALHGSGCAVVDFGCARGQLRRWLDPRLFNRYVGVDITSEAFRGVHGDAIRCDWVEAAVEQYQPESIEGAVAVFSELLYYLDRPDHHLARLCCALQAGCAIVSMTVPGTRHPHYRKRVARIWQSIHRMGWPKLADLTLADELGGETWRIVATKPR